VVVLFPAGRVSRVQRHQFSTLGGNVLAVAVDGPFDRCQALAKEMLADPIQVAHLGLTSANSINIGRLIPQVFYYLHLARLRGWGRESVTPTPVVVPSGNLGNVTAGVMARAAGAPLGDMIAACNQNDALVRYLADGETVRVPVEPSSSTAMDVGEPSNLERLFHLFGTDPESLGLGVRAVTVPEAEVARTMRWAHEKWGEVLDPHTAVGVAGARSLLGPDAAATVLATAHPAKFPEVIRQLLGVDPPRVPRLTEALSREEHVVELTGGAGHLSGVIDQWIRDGAG
jgi:threonine synthase